MGRRDGRGRSDRDDRGGRFVDSGEYGERAGSGGSCYHQHPGPGCPGSLTSGRFHRFGHKISPVGIGGTPHASMYMYHGTADELLPITAARQLSAQYRARGANVVMVEHAGQTHGGDQAFGVAGAVAFLTKKFAQHH